MTPDEVRDRMDELRVETQSIAAQLRAIWNPDTKRYEPYSEMVRLHDWINRNMLEYMQLKQGLRRLAREVAFNELRELEDELGEDT